MFGTSAFVQYILHTNRKPFFLLFRSPGDLIHSVNSVRSEKVLKPPEDGNVVTLNAAGRSTERQHFI